MKTKDYLTLLNGISGFLGIILALQGSQIAPLYIIPAIIFDFLDGRFARSGRPDSFGKELDSLSDLISFIIAPSIIVYTFAPSLLILIALILFVCNGLIRLARFNIQKEKKFFFGFFLRGLRVRSACSVSSQPSLSGAVCPELELELQLEPLKKRKYTTKPTPHPPCRAPNFQSFV